MTIKWHVLARLDRRSLMTATEVCRTMPGSMKTRPSLATVSSILTKSVKSGHALRVKGFGPRGGYGYVLTVKGEDLL